MKPIFSKQTITAEGETDSEREVDREREKSRHREMEERERDEREYFLEKKTLCGDHDEEGSIMSDHIQSPAQQMVKGGAGQL